MTNLRTILAKNSYTASKKGSRVGMGAAIILAAHSPSSSSVMIRSAAASSAQPAGRAPGALLLCVLVVVGGAAIISSYSGEIYCNLPVVLFNFPVKQEKRCINPPLRTAGG